MWPGGLLFSGWSLKSVCVPQGIGSYRTNLGVGNTERLRERPPPCWSVRWEQGEREAGLEPEGSRARFWISCVHAWADRKDDTGGVYMQARRLLPNASGCPSARIQPPVSRGGELAKPGGI